MAALDVALLKPELDFPLESARTQKAVEKNDLGFPRRVRKIRNILMPVLDPWFKLVG